ncbi:MAG: hypothetical protein U1E23_02340 [Reyranellaceae bacterium]
MTTEEIVQSIASLSWALDFALLAAALAVGTLLYRRSLRRRGPIAGRQGS